MKLVLCVCMLLLAGSWGAVAAQYDDEKIDTAIIDKAPEVKERKKMTLKNFFVGSTYRFGLGGVLLLDVAPYVGYRFADIAAIGMGIPYRYVYDIRTQRSSHVYGLRGFLRLRPFKEGMLNSVYLHGELEQLNLEIPNPNYNPSVPNSGIPSHLRSSSTGANVGFGITNNFAQGFGMTIELLYNLLYNSNGAPITIRNFPLVFRFGIYYGF